MKDSSIMGMEIPRSSAKNREQIVKLALSIPLILPTVFSMSMESVNGWVHITKSKGDRGQPCSTPCLNSTGWEKIPLICTLAEAKGKSSLSSLIKSQTLNPEPKPYTTDSKMSYNWHRHGESKREWARGIRNIERDNGKTWTKTEKYLAKNCLLQKSWSFNPELKPLP